MIEIESCIYVPEEPPFVNRQHYRIQDSTPWACTDTTMVPILGHLFDVYTSAPRGDSDNAASWLTFQGRCIARYSEPNIAILCNSSSYHNEIPHRHRHIPYPIVRGYLKVLDQGVNCLALDPDVSDSALFRFSSKSSAIQNSLGELNPGQIVYVSAYLTQNLTGIVDLEVSTVYIS
ncbi:uncharacterized protein PGTG_04629 [Puccinia graminis f. sp. tritici CRL 75-36-700-3]|uniref:Uncharacterized protein n=1 Tax=Puccinia graminis f. sp. tritici (strain CRL 75-36-700-3 / race SCCL) TaxID=418459 RepID=E3K2V4_PUCGT|nr:uncharacterized protein PGTG_04629 [Puccinia graminis f. sp. tritici CRL 75-36-700-3]EFP78673.1 hypothetical protein PGTG_04629 [Puccinia graminis f. sp. tritici CRL 75-36-700-3]